MAPLAPEQAPEHVKPQQHINAEMAASFTFLSKVYELSADSETHSVPIWDVGKNMGLNEPVAEQIASDLQELNMLHYTSLAGDVALTSFGVSEIILAKSQPDMPTTHFPALATFTDQMMLPLSDESVDPDDPNNINNLIDRFSRVKGWMSDDAFSVTSSRLPAEKKSKTSTVVVKALPNHELDFQDQEQSMWDRYEDDKALVVEAVNGSALQTSIQTLQDLLGRHSLKTRYATRKLVKELKEIERELVATA